MHLLETSELCLLLERTFKSFITSAALCHLAALFVECGSLNNFFIRSVRIAAVLVMIHFYCLSGWFLFLFIHLNLQFGETWPRNLIKQASFAPKAVSIVAVALMH